MKTLITLVLVFASFDVSMADWKDNLKKFGDGVKGATEKTKEAGRNARKKWKESEQRCDVCGKVIHGTKRCVSCRARQAKERARRVRDSAKKKWEDRTRPCSSCRKEIHVGTMCHKCALEKAKARGSEAAKKVSAVAKEMHSTAKRRYGAVLDTIKDPKVREQATATIGVILKVRSQIKAIKKSGVRKGFDLLAKIPVGNGETFGDVAVERLLEKYPELGSTGLCDDPCATATAIVCHDSRFFLTEVKIINKGGENVSVFGAIRQSSSLDASETIKYLKIAEATNDVARSLNTGDDLGGAVDSVFGAIKTANEN